MLLRYLSGKSSDTENKIIHNKLEQNLRLQKLVEVLQYIWGLKRKPIQKQDVDAAWLKFRDRILTESPTRKSPAYQPVWYPRPKKLAMAFRVAVISLILVAAGYYFIQQQALLTEQSEIHVTTIMVDKGERRRVTLPDGTRIMMDAGSEIRYSGSFLKQRKLTLKGEAYFEVVKNDSLPFSVYANHALVQVLGTKFNVRAWNETNRVEVAVTEGKVAVKNREIDNSVGVQLRKGEFSLVKEGENPIQPRQVNVEAYLGWMHNVIDFRDVKVCEVFAQLERWYDYEITIEDTSFLEQHMTINVNPYNVDDVFELISMLTKTELKRKGKRIRFVTER